MALGFKGPRSNGSNTSLITSWRTKENAAGIL
jgi:hypothetical protein